MEITYYGAGCVTVATKELTVLIDPVTGEYGPNPKVKAGVVLYSQLPQTPTITQAELIIDTPGEYEIKGLTIDGVAARLHTEESAEVEAGTMYTLSYKDLRVLVCGNIHPSLTDDQIERVDGVDVLVIPVGGKGLTLDKEAASDLVRQFDPNFVIPVHYDDGVSTYPVPQDTVDGFLHEVGASDAATEDSFKITSRDSGEDTTFVVLKPKK